MRVLVTGGSGFTGRHVLPELVSRGHGVVALARSATSADAVEALGAEPIWGDLDDPASVDGAFAAAKADCLINIASLGFGHATTLVAAAEAAGLRRAVFVSTTAIFTKLPAASKTVRVAAEEEITNSELDWTIIRPTMIYGAAGDRNISRLVALASKSPVLPIPGAGMHLQQPVHVEDLASSIVSAAERTQAIGKTYDVAGPEPITFLELLERTMRAVGRRPRFVRLPIGAARRVLDVYERIDSSPRLKVEQLDRLEEDKAFDITAAVADLDHAPRTFEAGVNHLARTMGLAE